MKGDLEETEDEEPGHRNVVSVSALKRRSIPAVASRVLSCGVRKKPKLPKVANWTIARNELCMSHSKKGKLVISGGSKAKKSGLNTPRGIMPVDPKKLTAFDLGLSNLTQKFTQSSNTLQSFDSGSLYDAEQGSALFSATSELSGPLFSGMAQDTHLESVNTHEPFYYKQPGAEEDLERFVDFLDDL
jgi:hypothetical protein